MGRPGAYLEIEREERGARPACEAVGDFGDYTVSLSDEDRCAQASRCMDCGVAFCQTGAPLAGSREAVGCPLRNLIPETNDLLYRKRWADAAGRLALTNPFPEFTGRVCPAPCEIACNLGLHDEAVTIHDNERFISDFAWERGIEPLPAAAADAPLVSVVGSGPAGLAAAWELARLGARVKVFERDDRPGGLLMYGIPSMKLPKDIVVRRVDLMERSGIEFFCRLDACEMADAIMAESDAVVVACGARVARRVDVPGAGLPGIHFALEYLTASTRSLLDGGAPAIDARGKDVVVVGGGDTGVDCVATALRQGARSVRQVIRARRLPDAVDTAAIWPAPRKVFSQGYGQREAQALQGEDPRDFSVDTIGFEGDADGVSAVLLQDLSYEGERHRVPGTERSIPAQLVLIAKGFTGADQSVIDAFSGFPRLYVAGDARLGSTIVARAMADALDVARTVASDLGLV